jgi:hypothetical protein
VIEYAVQAQYHPGEDWLGMGYTDETEAEGLESLMHYREKNTDPDVSFRLVRLEITTTVLDH